MSSSVNADGTQDALFYDYGAPVLGVSEAGGRTLIETYATGVGSSQLWELDIDGTTAVLLDTQFRAESDQGVMLVTPNNNLVFDGNSPAA